MLQADALRSRRRRFGLGVNKKRMRAKGARGWRRQTRLYNSGGKVGLENDSGIWRMQKKRTQHSMAFYVYKCTVEIQKKTLASGYKNVSIKNSQYFPFSGIYFSGGVRQVAAMPTAELAMSGFIHCISSGHDVKIHVINM